MKMKTPLISSQSVICKLRDIEEFCVGTRASVKARGETVAEVHGVE